MRISLAPRAFLAAVLVSLWTGAGLFFAAAVARAAFAVLPSRSLAGALVGRLLPVIFISGIIVMLVALVLTHRGAGLRRSVSQGAAAFAAATACFIAQVLLAPRIAALRNQIGGSLDSLAPGDPLRQQFGRLHAGSVALLGVALLASAVFLASLYLAGRSDQPSS